MTKRAFALMAAASLVASSTAAVAATPGSTVQTPLTQPATESVSGSNQVIESSGLAILFGVGAFAGLAATVALAIKTGDKGNTPPVRTSP